MEPGLKHVIGQGFKTANHSWAGIAFFGGSLVVVILLALLGIAVTNPPAEVLQQTPRVVAPAAAGQIVENSDAMNAATQD